MENSTEKKHNAVDIGLEQIKESYVRFRLPDPGAEQRMRESVRKYGQITPGIVAETAGERYEMIDGFKRLHACRRLGLETMKVTVLAIGVRGLKAAIVELNRKSGSLRPIEEALVVQSLYREDLLAQVEIAALLGRHKSWVSRRIRIVEQLCDEVLEHIRLGLVRVSMSRHLGRLPRGNQANTLSTILKHRFTCRETERLVALLLESPRWEQEAILRFPEPILSDRIPPRPKGKQEEKAIVSQQSNLEQMSLSIEEILQTLSLVSLGEAERARLQSVAKRAATGLNKLQEQMEGKLF